MVKFSCIVTFVFLSMIGYSQTITPAKDTTICPGGTTLLTVNSAVSGTSFQWLQGPAPGVPIPNEVDSTYSATAPGTYRVALSGNGKPNDTLGPINVTQATTPTASFTFSPNTIQCGNTPITFTSTSGAGLTNTWQFSDPSSGPNNDVTTTSASTIHKFISDSGNTTYTFPVTLTVTNAAGCSGSITQGITINEIPAPLLSGPDTVTFQGQLFFRQCATTASNLTFTNQTFPANNSQYEISWEDSVPPLAPDFMSSTFPASLSHIYKPGNYTLEFIVTGINGCVDTARYGVFVGDSPSGGIGTINATLTGCTGSTFTFPFLPAVFSNSAGTYYNLWADDNPNNITVFSQPPPPSYLHTFNKPSCGNGTNGANFFTVYLNMTNPCNPSGIGGTINGIKIQSTPKAQFTISPDTLCTTQTATLTDESLNNYVNQSGQCQLGKSVWSISGIPVTDWSISGILGSENGSSNPAKWTAGSSPLPVTFKNPGLYKVNLMTAGDTTCGIDSVSKTICVNPPAVANFSFAKDTVCTSTVDSVIYTPAIEYCGHNTYAWSVVSYAATPGCTPSTAKYTYVDGTNASSANPHFQFLNPGTYTIHLTAYSPDSSCSAQSQQNVVVNGVPFDSLPPATALVCVNQPYSFTASVSCFLANATYKWLLPGSTNPMSTLLNPFPVIYHMPGNYTVTLSVKNACGTSTATEPVSVDTLIAANSGSNQTLCGSTATMAANSPGTGTGMWTEISGPSSTLVFGDISSPTTTITGLVTGTYIFQWKIANGGCADSSQVTITIVPGPTTADAGPDQELCRADSVTLAAILPLTGTGMWSYYSGPPGSIIKTPSSPTTLVTGLVPGKYQFIWTVSFGNCQPSTDTVQITIDANPSLAYAGPDQTICLSATTLSGSTLTPPETGLWTGPPVIGMPSLPTTTISGLVSGTYTFTWTISNGVCPSSSSNVQINVSTIANNIINSSQSICINTIPATLTGSVPNGGNGNYAYQWQQSTDGGTTWSNIAGAINVNYSPGLLTQNTCYERIVTTTLCPTGNVSNTVCITVNPKARALFEVSDTILCAPVNLDTIISVTPFPNQDLLYSWYGNDAFISSNSTGSPPSFLISNPGQTFVIKLITSSLYGCSSDSMSITLRTLPSVTTSFTQDKDSGCGPLSVNFTNTSSILNNTIVYNWDFGNGTTLTNVMQPPGPVIFAASPLFRDTTYYITLKAFSGCTSTIKKDSVKVFANPKARFTSISTGCSPFRDTIINNSLGQDAFTTYSWDFGDKTTAITHVTNDTLYHTYNTRIIETDTIRLIDQNRCGIDSEKMNVVITPNIIKPEISIDGNELYGCAPQTVTFHNSSLGASVLYWDFGDHSGVDSIPNSQSVISHTYAKSGDYTMMVTLENDCTDTTIVRQDTVYDPPLASFNLSNTLLCTGNAVSANNTSSNANSYEWYWGDGTSTPAFNASHTYADSGAYSVSLVARKINAFGTVCTDTSAAIVVTVVARIAAIVDISTANSCAPYTINVSAENAGNAANVDWYFYDSNVAPGIFHVSGPSAAFTYNNAGIDSVKLVIANKAGCVDSTIKQFTVHNTPTVIFTPLNAKTCNTDTTIIFSATVNYAGTDNVNFEWFINDSLSGNSNPFAYEFRAPCCITASDQFNIKVLAANSFGCGDTTIVGNLTIETLGNQQINVAPSVVQEQPHYTFTFIDSATALPNSTYLWFTGDATGVQLPGKTITYTYSDTGTYHVHLLVSDYETGCSVTDSVTVYILGVPGYLYVPNAFCPGCQKAELRQFLPLGKGLKDYHLVIFNIWGQKVFETTSIDANGVPNQPWNGNWVSGKNTQQGAFSWHIEAHYINGTEWKGMLNPKTNKLEKQGFVSIIR